MGQVLQDMTKENHAVNTRNWASASRKCYHCKVPPGSSAFSVQTPNVTLASEEASEPEIVHLSKRGWERNCKNTKGPRAPAWKPPGSGETEARLSNLGLGCVVSPGAGFGGLAWESSPIVSIHSPDLQPNQRRASTAL